jgi:hypothetical protein
MLVGAWRLRRAAHGRWRAARWDLDGAPVDWEPKLAALSSADYVETPHGIDTLCSPL